MKAGVRHVVCCQQESQLMDTAALAFTRAFYLALAVGRSVQESFAIGIQAVSSAPSIPKEEVGKFLLLPEDGDHDESVFCDVENVENWSPRGEMNGNGNAVGMKLPFRKSLTGSGNAFDFGDPGGELGLALSGSGDWGNGNTVVVDNNTDAFYTAGSSVPTTAEDFLGREVEIYSVLNAVLNRRLVTVVGGGGVGRSSLISATCNYIMVRSKIINIDDILYVRAGAGAGAGEGSWINSLFRICVSAGVVRAGSGNEDDLQEEVIKGLQKKKVLLVFDHCEGLGIGLLEFQLFLQKLFTRCRNAKVLLTAKEELGLKSGRVHEHTYCLGPVS